MSCNQNTPNVNKTFIIEPQVLTGGTPVFSACTTVYTNLLESCSGDTSIQLGTGFVTFNSNIDGVSGFTATTIEATSIYSGGTNLLDIFSQTDTFVTGGTFSDIGDSLSLVRNDGANVIITGITNFFTTGGTYDNNTNLISFDRTDQLSAFTVDLSTIDVNDTFSTGGTYNNVTDIITISNNDGGSFNISGITDYYTTGATLIGDIVYFDREDALSAYTADLSALDTNDTFVSGFTRNGNVLAIERNDGVNLPLDISDIVFSGGSGNCITDLYVTNIYGCSPVTIHDELNVSGDTQLAAGLKLVTTPTNDDSLTQILSRDTDGTVKYRDVASIIDAASADTFVTAVTYDDNNNITVTRNDGTGFTANISVMSGLTVDGTVSATTLDGSTILSGGTDLLNIFALSGSDTNSYTTGTTLIGSTAYFDRNDSLSAYTLDLSSLDVNDTFVTGMTFNTGNYQVIATRNDGFSTPPIDLSILASDMVVTGGTYDINTGIVTFANNSGSTFEVSGFTSGMTDSYTTSANLSGDSITFDNNLIGTNAYNVSLLPLLSGKTDVTLFNTYTGDTETLIGTKVDTTLFNTYTGDTQTELDAKALQADLVSHTGDTNNPHNVTIAQVSGVSETSFNTYTGNTEILIDAKVETTLFNTYTGDTATALSTKVEGGNNVGGQSEVFRDKTGTTLNFRTLSGGTNTTVTTVGDVNVIDVALPPDSNTFVTGFTYDNNNNLSIIRNDGTEFISNISVMSGLTVNGVITSDNIFTTNLSATTIDASLILSGTTNLLDLFALAGSDTNTFVTGGTVSDDTTITLTRNDDVNILITGVTGIDLFNSHTGDTNNPHAVTFSALTSTAHTHTIADVINLQTELDAKALQVDLVSHTGDTNNPHNVTIEQVSGVTETSFNTYTGNTQILIDAKVETTLFNTYTGDTATALSTKVEGASNVGAGAGDVFRDKTGTTLNFRTLSGGTNTTVTTVGDVNVIDVALPPDANTFTTGTTVVGPTLYFDRNDALSAYTADLSSFLDNTNYYATGGTYNSGTESIDFSGNNVDANFTVDVSSLLDDTNTYITGFTYDDANTLTIVRNDLAAFSVTINTMTGLTVDGSLSAVTVSATTFYGDGSNLTGLVTENTFTTGATLVGNSVYYDRTDALSAYTVDLSGLSGLTSEEDIKLFTNQSSTGIIYTDGLSVNGGDNTKFDLALTRGWIVDNTTDPVNPTTQYVDFSASTAITVTNLATAPVSYIGLTGSTSLDIVQQTSPFTFSQRRDILEVGVVVHTDNTIVNVVNNIPTIGIDPTSQLYDLIDGLGYFNIRDNSNVYSAFSALTISKTGGEVFKHGANYENDPKNPHVKTLSSGNTLTFRYRLQDSTEYGNTTQINPGIYDTGSGTGATPDNKYTIQRIYMFPSGISRLQYGQNLYDSLSDAQASIPTETFVVEQNMDENGLLRGFVVLRGDATDLTDPVYAKFINANHFGDAQDTVYGDAHRTEIVNHSSTGIREGGEMTVNGGDNSLLDISSGSGLIVDNYTSPDNPTEQDVRWDTVTGVTITNLTGDTGSFIFLDSNGGVVQFGVSTPPTEADKRDNIYLGFIGHASNVIINNVFNAPIQLVSPINQHEDLTSAIGPFSISGNRISNIPTTLELEKSSGRSFVYGGNFHTDPKSPSQVNSSALSGSTLIYAKGDKVTGPSGTTVDPNNYDPDGLGVITNIPSNNNFVAHRIWHTPINNVLVFQYGQAFYTNQATARDEFEFESFVVPPGLDEVAYLVAVIIVQDGSVNLDSATIIPQGKFAGTGGGGGGAVDTLQSAYDNSTQPEIITDATRTAVDFRVGSGADTDNVVTFQDNAGTINASITGEGYISATTVDGNTILSGGTNLDTLFATKGFTTFTADTGSVTATTLNDTIQFSGVNIDIITDQTNKIITFSATTGGGGGGEVNTASNIGGGEAIFSGKTGVDLEFKTLTSTGGTVTISSTGATVNLEAASGSGSGTGLTATILAGENLVSGDLVYLNTDGKYWKADNTAEATSSTELRLATETILADATGEALNEGQYITTGLTTGATYWVGTSGTFTVTQPSAGGDIVRYVGTASSDTVLEFNPDEMYIELGAPADGTDQPSIREATATGNILSTDWTVYVTSTGATTQTLPTAIGIKGKVYNIKNLDSTSVGVVTVDTTSSQTIDIINTSVIINYPNNLTFQSTGSDWIII